MKQRKKKNAWWFPDMAFSFSGISLISIVPKLSLTPSFSLDTGFCLDALEESFGFGTPEIFNSDQGCQFTSTDFAGKLEAQGIRISMYGKGRWLDNVFLERLWKTLKYDD